MMAYLVRSMQTGGELGKALWRTMVTNTEAYLADGVRAGTIKPSRDPAARAKYLAMVGGGAFLLYLQLHDNPTDLRAVLHDYSRDMVLPALELYTEGLLTDSTMFEAFLAREGENRDNDNDTTPSSRTDTAAVEIRGLVKKFGGTTALDGLDLTVARGSVTGFLGPNGAGKSTTIRVLLGLLRADGGTARLLGRDPGATPSTCTGGSPTFRVTSRCGRT